MKKLIFIALMLVGFGLQAQEYQKLSRWIEESVTDTSLTVYDCHYDDDGELTLIEQKIDDSDDPYISYHYNSDTMYMSYNHTYNSTIDYEYTTDTVYLISDGDTIEKYNIDSEFQIVEGGTYQWEGGNCVSRSGNWSATFQEFRNPWVFAQLYLKGVWWFNGFTNGSYNLQDKITLLDGTEFTMEVTQSIDEWPYQVYLKIEGMVIREFIIEYRDLVGDIPEIPSETATILQVDYYDLMGREIPKPTKGFYIERKVTDKGIISTKHFIQ
jgi:hypothetical protein